VTHGTTPEKGFARRRLILGSVLLVGLTLLAYAPALNGGFVWDDDNFLTQNPLIKANDGLWRLWLTTQAADYWPLTSTTLWIEWRVWGMNPVGYHATNLLLHLAEAGVLWRILQRLGIPGAFFAALLFALHPVNVESVAWITQRKNLVAMLFFLMSILFFLKANPDAPPVAIPRPGSKRWFALSLLAFALAMLGKGSVAPLPFVLLGIIWWRRRLVAGDWIRLAPFFAVAAIFTVINLRFQSHVYAHFRNAGLMERTLGAAGAILFYLGKALWPANLSFIYRQWSIRPDDFRWWIPFLAAIGVTLGLGILGRRGGSPGGRGALFAWLYFCAMLVPVMGFTDVGFMVHSLVADHFQHLALIGVTTLAAAGLVSGLGRLPSAARPAAWALCCVMIGLFSLLTWRQSLTFHDQQTLFSATLERNPDSWMAQNNLGVALEKIPGRRPEAIAHFEAALRLRPLYAEAHDNLAKGLLSIPGRGDEALAHFEAAVRIDPDFGEAHYNLANALMQIPGRMGEALAHYEEVLRLDPSNAETQNNVAVVYTKMGRYGEAIAHLELAVKLNPGFALARENLSELQAMRR
jgi:tetratricopeptide (TPR) repeat protein